MDGAATTDDPSVDEPAQLTPTQQRTLDLLRRRGEPVIFDPELIEELTTQVTDAIATFTERIGADTLAAAGDRPVVFVNKGLLWRILGCEAHALIDDEFAWSPSNAGGQIAHRAIQLGINWRGQPTPLELVDEALARTADENWSLGDWVAGLSEADRSDLRGGANERVTRFMECFPPLLPKFWPTTETGLRYPVAGPIVMSGKVDLTIGRPSGREARKVIIDLKTGQPRPQHREDLRFYAVVETLRSGVPPRKLASYYLDAADAETEDVTEAILRSGTRRILDGINAIIELRHEGRPPLKRPGPTCNWCSLIDHCEQGQAHLKTITDDY